MFKGLEKYYLYLSTYIDFSAIIVAEVRRVNVLEKSGKQSKALYVDSCGYQLLDSGGRQNEHLLLV